MLLVTFALFSPGGGWPKRVLTIVFVGLAAYSSFLAVRSAVVAPDNRFHELASNPIGCINVSNLKEFRTFTEVVHSLVRPSLPIRRRSTA